MHSAATAKVEVAWCADPSNHAIVITAEERFSGIVNKETAARALECVQRCGFAKLSGLLNDRNGRNALLEASAALRMLLDRDPDSPLLARLRPSKPLDGDPPAASPWPDSFAALLGQGTAQIERPWIGLPGRAMVDMPFASPFNHSLLTRNPLVMPIVASLLGGAEETEGSEAASSSSTSGGGGSSLGVVIEQAAHIMVGPRTGSQQVHTDATHFTSQATDAGVFEDAVALASRASKESSEAKSVFDRLQVHACCTHTRTRPRTLRRREPLLSPLSDTYAVCCCW